MPPYVFVIREIALTVCFVLIVSHSSWAPRDSALVFSVGNYCRMKPGNFMSEDSEVRTSLPDHSYSGFHYVRTNLLENKNGVANLCLECIQIEITNSLVESESFVWGR